MRPEERIDIYLNLLENFPSTLSTGEERLDDMMKTFYVYIYQDKVHLDCVRNYWKKHPDYRFTQVMVNYGIFPNFPGSWYYTEDMELMEKLGYATRSVFLWGTYGKNGNEPLKYILLKDMTDEHIKAVIETQIKNPHIPLFVEELAYRNITNNNKHEDMKDENEPPTKKVKLELTRELQGTDIFYYIYIDGTFQGTCVYGGTISSPEKGAYEEVLKKFEIVKQNINSPKKEILLSEEI